MTRSDLRERFRTENPEVTERVITDALLNDFLFDGDKETCAMTRCVVGDTEWTSVEDDQYWDLTQKIDNFFDIDEYPGGGVAYDDDRLEKTTIAQLDEESSAWRTRSSGTPKKYFRRGQYLWFDRPVDDALTIQVYAVLISDDFDNDTIMPFNQLPYLEPFHGGLIKYLQWRVKAKIGKTEEAKTAKQEWLDFVAWMKKELGGGKYGIISLRPYDKV